MAIGTPVSKATIADATDATLYTSGTFSASPGDLLVAFIQLERTTSDVEVPLSVVTTGLTWTLQKDNPWTTGGATNRRLFCYTAYSYGTITTQTLAVTMTSTHIGCTANVIAVPGCGEGAPVVQAVNGSGVGGTSAPASLGASSDADNRTLYAMALNAAAVAITPAASWTELVETGHSAPTITFETQYRVDAYDGSGNAAWTGAQQWGAIVIEIRAAANVEDLADQYPVLDPFPIDLFFPPELHWVYDGEETIDDAELVVSLVPPVGDEIMAAQPLLEPHPDWLWDLPEDGTDPYYANDASTDIAFAIDLPPLASDEVQAAQYPLREPHPDWLWPLPDASDPAYANDASLDIAFAIDLPPLAPDEVHAAQPVLEPHPDWLWPLPDASEPYYSNDATTDAAFLVDLPPLAGDEIHAAQPTFGEYFWPAPETEDWTTYLDEGWMATTFAEPIETFAAQPHYGEWFWPGVETEDYTPYLDEAFISVLEQAAAAGPEIFAAQPHYGEWQFEAPGAFEQTVWDEGWIGVLFPGGAAPVTPIDVPRKVRGQRLPVRGLQRRGRDVGMKILQRTPGRVG